LSLVSGILKDNYKVKVATSGAKALAICAASAPSLVLLDIMMPEMDGFEVCRRLKKDPVTATIPVVFFSAKGTEEDRVQGTQSGGAGFLVKPIDPNLLLQMLQITLAAVP
jgi:putative two-component system response regulator